jgi:hypothetical protein
MRPFDIAILQHTVICHLIYHLHEILEGVLVLFITDINLDSLQSVVLTIEKVLELNHYGLWNWHDFYDLQLLLLLLYFRTSRCFSLRRWAWFGARLL